MSPETLVELREVTIQVPATRDWLGRPRAPALLLDRVSLALYSGETLGVLGESGSGKSTLAHTIAGLRKATSGTRHVLCSPATLEPTPSTPRARRPVAPIQLVPQDPHDSLNPRRRIWRIVSEPLDIAFGATSRVMRVRAHELGALVGLSPEHLERFPHQLSGGQQQRVAIARALAVSPQVLILDEPTSALDVSVQAQILNLLLDLQRQLRLAYLFISHDVAVVRHVSDRVAVMRQGQIVECGTAFEVLRFPKHPYTRELLRCTPMVRSVSCT